MNQKINQQTSQKMRQQMSQQNAQEMVMIEPLAEFAVERRQPAGDAAPAEHSLQNDVRKAVALRQQVGVIAAIEYLKTVGADCALIERVLFAGSVRAGDRELGPRVGTTSRRWSLRGSAI